MIFNNYPVEKKRLKKIGSYNLIGETEKTININHTLYDEIIVEITGQISQNSIINIGADAAIQNYAGNKEINDKYIYTKTYQTSDSSRYSRGGGAGISISPLIITTTGNSSYISSMNITVTIYAKRDRVY